MKTTENTVLITGGTSGIGFEIAKLLSTTGNQVIITGRNQHRLNSALSQLKNASGILGDISSKVDTENLVATIKKDFPELNVIINNAGKAVIHNLLEEEDNFGIAVNEMLTNYLSVIRLNQLLLPLLSEAKEAAIINVSSILAIVPRFIATSTYAASKAALHSYTLSLRTALINSNIKVFELMPPLVNTSFSSEIGGENGIPPSEVAYALLNGLKENIHEIHVGQTQYIYDLYLKSPEEALQAMNQKRE
ncbi:SDR family NAD(P)-dependent oxidoreductase [uncultured Bacteroides sp.]|uniref:SDR family oxidoreductase n=1 Tax=uncultured Bacteroides sp. TaxID=162156 RepID=UPI002AA65A26|nr:SDR family NAD(P)-dependent oxidoreductase [uncultured Bacteroides sp.]